MKGAETGGFTLIEVLVALVVLSVSLVAVLQLFGGGLRLVGTAGEHLGATLIATAKLAEPTPEPIQENTTDGEDGPYHWTRRITFDKTLLPLDASRPELATLRLARISVEVRWGGNRHVEMATLRAWREKQ